MSFMWPFSETGKTQIWYMKPETWRTQASADPKDLSKTHVLLGAVQETDLEMIFSSMQGEIWSPNGEAKRLIKSKDLAHTSMSTGDIVVLPSGVKQMVDIIGFKILK